METLLPFTPRYHVRRCAPWLTLTESRGEQTRVLAVLDLRKGPVFFLQDEHVVCRDSDGIECNITPGDEEDAASLMAAIAQALPAQTGIAHQVVAPEGRRMRFFLAIFLMGGIIGSLALLAWDIHDRRAPARDTDHYHETQVPDAAPSAPVLTMPPAVADRLPPAPDTPPGDGWSLPVSVRATLPGKLKNAADRGLFTVNYSRGHARTLYVFADPHCPNCRRLEPALNAAAVQANVVVFPVAVVGREASVSSVTPVLCLPPEKRKAAWDALFDVGHDARQMGNKPAAPTGPSADCDLAGKALGVNEVAYQTYRIPGTPWVIADDGRHVPQKVLRDPAALKAFLEVSDAAR